MLDPNLVLELASNGSICHLFTIFAPLCHEKLLESDPALDSDPAVDPDPACNGIGITKIQKMSKIRIRIRIRKWNYNTSNNFHPHSHSGEPQTIDFRGTFIQLPCLPKLPKLG